VSPNRSGNSAPDSELLLPDELEELGKRGAEVNHLLARAIQNMMLDREPESFVYKDPGIMAIVGRGST
jgi:hypothetical protein